jgi:hypothetical protein
LFNSHSKTLVSQASHPKFPWRRLFFSAILSALIGAGFGLYMKGFRFSMLQNPEENLAPASPSIRNEAFPPNPNSSQYSPEPAPNIVEEPAATIPPATDEGDDINAPLPPAGTAAPWPSPDAIPPTTGNQELETRIPLPPEIDLPSPVPLPAETAAPIPSVEDPSSPPSDPAMESTGVIPAPDAAEMETAPPP